jgi:hypothetical protein
MERTIISWSVPNLITIWLMLAIGFLALSLGVQFAMRFGAGNGPANNSGGY